MSGVTDEAEMDYAARHYAVFGRVSPQQKKQLVQALRRQGRCVAMTGDGVNDLLALREADCSIAVAEGSEAARQIAQVVLINNDFGQLPEVLGQGRRVVNNTTRVAGVFFVKTIYSTLLSVCCLLMNIPFPLIPIQITLIDALIEGYPAFFMSFEPDRRKVEGRFIPSVMRRVLPDALSIVACFLLIRIGHGLLTTGAHPAARLLPERQMDTLVYLLVGTVGIQAVFKASWPLNRLRAFLCLTMTAGFYAAVFLFGSALSLAVPNAVTLLLACGFALLSFALERGAAWVIRRLWQESGKRRTTGAQLARTAHVDFILAVGGGSVIDCCKVISAQAMLSEDIFEMEYGAHRFPAQGIPMSAVVTASGTGAEMNAGAVITHEEKKWKGPIFGTAASFAALDPAYTLSLPMKQVISGAFDTLSHCMETYLGTPLAEMGIADERVLRAVADTCNLTAGCCKRLTRDEVFDILKECL